MSEVIKTLAKIDHSPSNLQPNLCGTYREQSWQNYCLDQVEPLYARKSSLKADH